MDPLGNEVIINQTVSDLNESIIQSEDILDTINKVIERPAMLFKMNEEKIQLYYLRAIGWHKTMLIGVQKTSRHFEVINYQLDPPLEILRELQSKGQRLI
jgi:hypothetical protein